MDKRNIRFDRLRDLEAHLRTGTLLHEQFDFGTVNNGAEFKCGTAGCAIGELPALGKKWGKKIHFGVAGVETRLETGKLIFSLSDLSKELFGLEMNQAWHLFMPNEQSCDLYGGKELDVTATRYDVADNILAFIEKMETV